MDASELELVPWVHTTTVIKHSGTTNRLGSCPMRFVRFVCLLARYCTVALLTSRSEGEQSVSRMDLELEKKRRRLGFEEGEPVKRGAETRCME